MTDCDFLLHVLSDGEKHSLNEILQRSFRERGCGLTVHSRASDLRRLGWEVANWKDGDRGNGSWYRLGPLVEAGVAHSAQHVAPVSTSGPGVPSPELNQGRLDSSGQLVMDAPQFRKQQRAA